MSTESITDNHRHIELRAPLRHRVKLDYVSTMTVKHCITLPVWLKTGERGREHVRPTKAHNMGHGITNVLANIIVTLITKFRNFSCFFLEFSCQT
eukprot:728280-Amphidinium_carterae.1